MVKSRLAMLVATVLLSAVVVVAPAEAAFPGQNGKIALLFGNSETSFGIFTVNPDGSGSMRLTDDGAHPGEMSPAWSADGRKIAFARPSPEISEIWTMNA